MAILTEREYEIKDLVVKGLTNLEIARRLSIEEKTVKFHMTSIMAKNGVQSRSQLISNDLTQTLVVSNAQMVNSLKETLRDLNKVEIERQEILKKELLKLRLDHKNKEEIAIGFNGMLTKMRIHLDSDVAKKMLVYLNESLGW